RRAFTLPAIRGARSITLSKARPDPGLKPNLRRNPAASPCFYPLMEDRIRIAVFDLAIAMASLTKLDADLAFVSTMAA
ncbi:MAG: hypothetical protein OEU92_24705, partial [Alphaproteobacteria bacterium]|nr:hypothetical protein [Alphaproteobacteria bacterium]